MPRTDLSWRTHRPAEGFYNSEVPESCNRPVRTFMPTGYEPNYPYPLVVFFHGQGGSEEQILRLAPRLSRRNYVCISLRGTQSVESPRNGQLAWGWGPDAPLDHAVEEYVVKAIEQTRRFCHIHSERIYFAGICEGATLAYRLALTFPDKIAGVISLNGTMPRFGSPLLRLPDIRRLRVLIGHGIANAISPLSMARRDHNLLYSAGLDVSMYTYPTTHRIHPNMLRDVNRWLMSHIEEEQRL